MATQSRGAALGRHSFHASDKEAIIKLYIQRVRMKGDGAYDCNGTYWGVGPPLWWCSDDNGDVDFVVRANSVGNARERIRRLYPFAMFFRESVSTLAELRAEMTIEVTPVGLLWLLRKFRIKLAAEVIAAEWRVLAISSKTGHEYAVSDQEQKRA